MDRSSHHGQSSHQSNNQSHHRHDDDMDDFSIKNHQLPILPTLSAIPTALADNTSMMHQLSHQSINQMNQNMLMNLSPLMSSNTGMSMMLPPMMPLQQSMDHSDHQSMNSLSSQSMMSSGPPVFQPTINQSPSHSQSIHQSSHQSSHQLSYMPISQSPSHSHLHGQLSQSNQSPSSSMHQSSHQSSSQSPTHSNSQSSKKAKPSPKERDSAYNRKDKSLGLLCENFIHQYGTLDSNDTSLDPSGNPNQPLNQIMIDEVSKSMGIERRRIYDIVNILEAAGVVKRKGKNSYQWFGMSQVAQRLMELKSCLEASEKETGGALAVGIHAMNAVTLGNEYKTPADVQALVNARAAAIANGESDFPEDPVANLLHHNAVLTARNNQPPGSHAPDNMITPKRAARPSQLDHNMQGNQSMHNAQLGAMHQQTTPNMHHMTQHQPMQQTMTPQSMNQPMNPSMNQSINQSMARRAKRSLEDEGPRKDQSLGSLTQVFLQMFLINETRIVSLEDAARWLLRGDTGEDSIEAQAINQTISQTLNTSAHHANTSMQASQQDSQQRPVASLTGMDHSLESLDHSMNPPDHTMHPMDSTMSQSMDQHMSHPSSQSSSQAISSPASSSGKRTNPALSVFRSKTRRLYDIANVLCALGLIEKIHLMSTRKPAFRWRDMQIYPLHSTIPSEKFNAEHINRRDAALKRKSVTSTMEEQQKKKMKVEEQSSINQSMSQSQKRPPPSRTSVWPHTGAPITESPTQSTTKSLSFSFHDNQSTNQSINQSTNQSSSSASNPASSPPSLPPPSHLPHDGGVPMFIDDNENRYWFSNPPHSFSIERSQMNAFKPLDFAYLPFLAPTDPSVTAAVHAASSIAKMKNSDLSTTSSDWPPHMSGVPPVMQASYIKKHDQFITMFSEVCQAWVNLIPDLNAKAIAQMRKTTKT